MSFEFSKVIINESYNILVNLNATTATGFDWIPCKFLRIVADPLAAIISDIVNMSISECTFPDALKYAERVFLLKRLDSPKTEDYRPMVYLQHCQNILKNFQLTIVSALCSDIF